VNASSSYEGYPHIVSREGVPFVVASGLRVSVRHLLNLHERGDSFVSIFKQYPKLGPAKILTALAFAYDHPEHLSKGPSPWASPKTF
jgi:uncharacterized protein (DUF433 family)